MNKYMLTILVIISLFIVACENVDVSKISDTDLARIAEKAIVCDEPYMRFGTGCCLDTNNNSICDNDDGTTVSDNEVSDSSNTVEQNNPSGSGGGGSESKNFVIVKELYYSQVGVYYLADKPSDWNDTLIKLNSPDVSSLVNFLKSKDTQVIIGFPNEDMDMLRVLRESGFSVIVRWAHVEDLCTDTDPANDIAIPGYCEDEAYSLEYGKLYDRCDSDTYLIQYECVSGNVCQNKPYKCPDGYECVEDSDGGICKEKKPICTDTDPANDIAIPGYCEDEAYSLEYGKLYDRCDSDTYLIQQECVSGNVCQSKPYKCPDGYECVEDSDGGLCREKKQGKISMDVIYGKEVEIEDGYCNPTSVSCGFVGLQLMNSGSVAIRNIVVYPIVCTANGFVLTQYIPYKGLVFSEHYFSITENGILSDTFVSQYNGNTYGHIIASLPPEGRFKLFVDFKADSELEEELDVKCHIELMSEFDPNIKYSKDVEMTFS